MCYGVDIGRNRDLTVIVAAEKVGGCIFVRGVLRMANMRGQSQLKEFRAVFGMRNFGRACLDRTGIGQFLVEFAQDLPGVGQHRAEAVHFASREPRENKDGLEREDTGLVTELMAMDLLRVFEGTGIKIPNEREFRDSLRKPERIATSNGVKIAATRDEAGHADEFWALALLVRAMKVRESQFAYEAPVREPSTPFLSDRHDRRLIALV
jgi:phage FluMu gp28-like protein